MKEELKVASVFIGTIVGAGLASGQEILQFFGSYGVKGYWGIFICCIIYIIFSIVITSLCFKFKFKSYREMILHVLGKRFGYLVDIILTLFIFGGNVIMISGGGAMLNEYLGINKIWGVAIMVGCTLLVSIFSTKGVIAINSFIVPMSTTCIVIMGILVAVTPHNLDVFYNYSSPEFPKVSFITSSILYSAFNLIGATGVICPMVYEMKNKTRFIIGCIIGSIVLTVLALIINYSILFYYPQSANNEIPNLFIAKQYGKFLPLFLTIIIWLEMFSTEIGDIYSLSNRIKSSFNIPYSLCIIIILVLSIPLSFIGFSNLIKVLYPPFGVIGLIFLIGSIFKYVKMKI